MANVTFQDDVLATPPSATVVATDDVGGAHYQRMKLVDGTDGSTTAAKVTTEGNVQAITPNRTASGTLNAQDEALTISCDGLATVVFHVTASDLSGAILSFEGSADGGTTWSGALLGSYYQTNPVYDPVDPSATDFWTVAAGPFTHIRARLMVARQSW